MEQWEHHLQSSSSACKTFWFPAFAAFPHSKGQQISKANYGVLDSSKKWTLALDNFQCSFFGKNRGRHFFFGIYWPLILYPNTRIVEQEWYSAEHLTIGPQNSLKIEDQNLRKGPILLKVQQKPRKSRNPLIPLLYHYLLSNTHCTGPFYNIKC